MKRSALGEPQLSPIVTVVHDQTEEVTSTKDPPRESLWSHCLYPLAKLDRGTFPPSSAETFPEIPQ